MKTKETFNKVVNFDKETNEIIVLDYVFAYNDGFKGATGSTFEPISRTQYDEIIKEYYQNPQAVSEYWEDSVGDFLSYDDTIAISEDKEEIMRLCGGLDDSYDELWDELREVLNLDLNSAYMFNCTGGGRCFSSDFKGNINTELSKIIREYETK